MTGGGALARAVCARRTFLKNTTRPEPRPNRFIKRSIVWKQMEFQPEHQNRVQSFYVFNTFRSILIFLV